MSSNTAQSSLNKEQKITNAIWFNVDGLFLAGAAWYAHNKEQYEQSQLKEVKGTIVDFVKRRKDKSLTDYEYAPVIEFANNSEIVRFNHIPHESYARSTGTEVLVRYNPQDPQTTAYMLDPWHDLLIWLPFVIAGLVFIGGFHALWKLVRS